MNPARALLIVSLLLYAACMPLDAFCVAGNCSDWQGWHILAFGWLAPGDGGSSWFANPLLLIAWILILRNRKPYALLLSIGALATGLMFLTAKTVVTNEGGIANPVTGYREGYWLWLASMAAAIVAALLIRTPRPKSKP